MLHPNDISLYIHTYQDGYVSNTHQFICKLQVRANTSTYKNMKMNHSTHQTHTSDHYDP